MAEKCAEGEVVLFASDPNFRGFTTGTQKLVWNAIFADHTSPDASGGCGGTAAPRSVRVGPGATALPGLALITVPAAARAAVVAAVGERARVTPLPHGLVRVAWPVGDGDGRSVLAAVLDRLGPVRDQVVVARVP